MQTLDQWRTARNFSFTELAKELGCNRTKAFRLCRGIAQPDQAEMAVIVRVTGGAVPPEAFFPEAASLMRAGSAA